jgi:hypothetical protein
LKTVEVPVSEAAVGDEYAHADETSRKVRLGIIRDIRFAGRRDHSRVIISVKFPGEKREREFRHDMVGTYRIPGVPPQEAEALAAVQAIHSAAVGRAAKLYGREMAA